MPQNKQKTVNLALQGGGSHGAFAWGVLDKLLEDGRINIEGICATSAGTMNACALAYGMHKGGPETARETLHDFWWNVHKSGQKYNPMRLTPWERMLPWSKNNPVGHFMFDTVMRIFSPYQFNPFDFNPLRDVLEKTIDFEALQCCNTVKLFISATHVKTGKVHIFKTKDITLDVAMASACLPFLFKAVKVKEEEYWDGGYMGNPALFPLFYQTDSRDIVIVHINPIERPETPTTAPEIMDRLNEISFNCSLLQEMRAIAFVKELIEDDMLKDEHKNKFKNILLHSVRADKALSNLSIASKFDSDWNFLTDLRDKGRKTMAAWLDKHYKNIGTHSTTNVHTEFL